ncbi:MAG: NAD-dependent epimerase/dehydratase family protein [Nannocystaceae bacterium]
MKALVTGAGGFLGGAMVRSLIERGDEVRGFSRGAHPQLQQLGVEQHRGDICDAAAVAKAVEGVDVVLHAAAKVAAAGAEEDFVATNIEGPKNVIDACRRHGVTALVYTSTPSVTFGLNDLEGVDESIGYSDHFDAQYSRTKAHAEKNVLAADGDALRTVALRPHLIWGPGDTSLLPRVLERGRAGVLRRISGATKRTDITYVDDAVAAHLLAADKLLGSAATADVVGGKPYFISSGEPIEIWEFVDRLLMAADLPPVRATIHPKVALSVAWLFEHAHTILGGHGDPRMTRWIVRELSTSRWFDISAARRDLGYKPMIGVDEGMQRLTRWLAEGVSSQRGV